MGHYPGLITLTGCEALLPSIDHNQLPSIIIWIYHYCILVRSFAYNSKVLGGTKRITQRHTQTPTHLEDSQKCIFTQQTINYTRVFVYSANNTTSNYTWTAHMCQGSQCVTEVQPTNWGQRPRKDDADPDGSFHRDAFPDAPQADNRGQCGWWTVYWGPGALKWFVQSSCGFQISIIFTEIECVD